MVMFSILKNITLISQIDIIKQTEKTSLLAVLYINDLCIKNIKIIYFFLGICVQSFRMKHLSQVRI